MELWESPSSVACLFNAKSSYRPCPVSVSARAYFSIPITLNYKYILLGSLCCDAIKPLVELFDLLVFIVRGWCIDLNDGCCVVSLRPETRMETNVLEMGVQLMILPTTSFRTVNASPYECLSLFRSTGSCVPHPW